MRDTCRDCMGRGCEYCRFTGWIGQPQTIEKMPPVITKMSDIKRVISTKLQDAYAKKFTDGVYGFTCPDCDVENELRENYTGFYFCGHCKQLLNIK